MFLKFEITKTKGPNFGSQPHLAFHVEVLQDYLAGINADPVPTTPLPSPGPTPSPMLPDRQEEFASPYPTEIDGTPYYCPETMEVVSPQIEVAPQNKSLQPASPPKAVHSVPDTPAVDAESLAGAGDFDTMIPELGDEGAPKSKVGTHDISKEAIRQRSKRIFTPRADGTLKVSQKIYEEWKGKGRGRRCLELIFKQVGYDPEPKLEIENILVCIVSCFFWCCIVVFDNVGVAVFKLNR